MNKNKRIDYIDLLRALGIIAMIMGHVGFGGFFDKWIHIFHMPMFFIISGYFFKEQDYNSLIKKRVKTLLIPYVVFGIIHLIIYFVRIGGIDSHSFYLLFWENTAENGIPIAGALWFLTALFLSEIVFRGVQSIKGSNVVKTLVSLLIAIIGMTCAQYLPFRLPWAIDVGLVGVGLYQIGKLIKDKWQEILEQKFIFSIIGILIFSGLGLVNGYVNLRQGCYGFWPLFWINTVGMTISLWNFARCVNHWMEEKGLFQKLMSWIRGMGRDSIIFLCLNQLAILLAGDLIAPVIPAGSGAMLLAKKLLILVIAMIELYFAQKVVMGTKLKVLTGKW